MADVKTTLGYEYMDRALQYADNSPMANTAIAVCDLRRVDAYENLWFQGHYIPRWRAVIIEGMMLSVIAEATSRS